MRAIIVASAVLVIACASLVSASCGTVTFSNGTKVDLSGFSGTLPSPLGSPQGTVTLNQGPAPYTGQYGWSFAPCTSVCSGNGQLSQAAGSTTCNLVMKFKSSPAASVDGKSIVAEYTGVDPSNSYTWNAKVNMYCSKTAALFVVNDYTVTVSGQTVDATFQTYSSAFCVGGGSGGTPVPGSSGKGNNTGNTTNTGDDSGGLTWGGVFLMCFFIPLGLYFIGFALWNYFKLELRGVEIIPHREFWGSLPGLFADGFKFIWCKIRSQPFESVSSGSSGGESAAAGGESGAATGAGGYTTV